jgi:hypothetical protein
MKQHLIAAALSCAALAHAGTAAADDRLVSFEGGIGSQVWARNAAGALVPNDVLGVQPGGRPWVIEDLRADVRTDGTIRVDGRGLLLGGGNNVGNTGGQSVHARLFCGGVAHNSGTVPLEPNGDFRIVDQLDPVPPFECANPILLIVSGVAPNGSWFAAGIPKR